LLSHQLALALVRGRIRREAAAPASAAANCAKKIEAALPFSLTGAQRGAIEEIVRDLFLPISACCGCCKAMSARARRWWR